MQYSHCQRTLIMCAQIKYKCYCDEEGVLPAGISNVRHVYPSLSPSGQIPNEPAVNGPHESISTITSLLHCRYIVHHPLDFSGGEIGGDGETRLFLKLLYSLGRSSADSVAYFL